MSDFSATSIKVNRTEELASHSVRANHQLIVDLVKIKDALERANDQIPDLYGLMRKDGTIIRRRLIYCRLTMTIFTVPRLVAFFQKKLGKSSSGRWKMGLFQVAVLRLPKENTESKKYFTGLLIDTLLWVIGAVHCGTSPRKT